MLLPEIAARLTAQSLVPAGYSLLQGKLPDTPDKVIVLYETGGLPPDLFMGSTAPVESCGLQVVTRAEANDYAASRTTIEAIVQAMLGWGAFTAGGVRYLGVRPQQSPFLFQRDANDRVLHAVNAIVTKELSA